MHLRPRLLSRAALCLAALHVVFAPAGAGKLFAQPEVDNPPGLIDGLRRIEARRYGVTVLHPPGWRLTNLMRGDRAFVLTLPEDHPSEPAGTVACEIGPAPASLSACQKQIAAEAAALHAQKAGAEQEPEKELVSRAASAPGLATEKTTEKITMKKLVSSQLLDAAPSGPEAATLEVVWSFKRPGFGAWFEMKRYVIQNRQLYTFLLDVDQGHFEAYRIEFVRMANSAKFRPPETGLLQVQGNYWMQRDFAFGMILPPGWLPAMGASEKALYFAAGPATQVFANNVLVMASKVQPLEFEALKAAVPDQVRKADPASTVVRCEVVTIGKRRMLETVIRTRRGSLDVTVLERRFQGKRLNYEIRFTILTEQFEKLETQLRESSDSFREFPLPGKGEVI